MTVELTASQNRRQQMLDAYEKRTDVLMSGLALVYLFTFSAQAIVYEPQATWFVWATWFGLALWGIFVVDLIFRVSLSPRRWTYLRTHVLDVVTVVLPALRPLRVLRAFNSDGILSKKRGALTGKAVTSAIVGTVLIVWVGSLMVLSAERGASGAEITSFGDAIWWSFETITTVGYGDFVPVTWLGRTFATAIMMVGISVLGVVSAAMAATLVKQGNPASAPTPTSNDEVLKELADLKQMVAALQSQLSNPQS